MSVRSAWVRGPLFAALAVGLGLGPMAEAAGGHGGGHKGGGGGHARAPRVPAAHRANPPAHKPAKTPHASAPAHPKAAKPKAPAHPNNANHAVAANHAHAANHAKAAVANRSATGKAAAGAVAPAHHAVAHPYSYTYGTGSHARHYRAHGYGRGYRNRYYGSRYGYGVSQSANRAIVSRLRSVHARLARLDRDYQGHRARAMRSIAMAVRQLSHRSMASNGTGLASGVNNGRNPGGLANQGARRAQPLTQAQSDARVGQALRSLQGVHMQLAGQVTNTSTHARARGHVQRAIGELKKALAIR